MTGIAALNCAWCFQVHFLTVYRQLAEETEDSVIVDSLQALHARQVARARGQ